MYIDTLCVRATNALVSLCICTGSSVHALLGNEINYNVSNVDRNHDK